MKEKWKIIEKHETEIRTFLKETKCMDSHGRIRAWKKDTTDNLKNLGHTSLDYEKCICMKTLS